MIFDLQRFNENGATENADSIENKETLPEGQNDFDFAINEDGEFIMNDEKKEEEIPNSEGEKEEEGTPKEEQPVYYTPEEIKEVGLDKLDPNKIPPDLVPFYRSMQADYTRKTQDLAKQRDAMEQAKPSTPPQPQQQEPKPKDYVEQLANVAIKRARTVLELPDDEPFNEYDPKHLAAYNIELNNIYAEANRQQTIQAQVDDLIMEYREKEPDNFDEINQYAEYRLKYELPRAESDKVMFAMQRGNVKVLREFVEDTRQQWYEKHLGLKQKPAAPAQKANPPKVESAGQGTTHEVPKQRNIHDFRGKPVDDQVKKLIEWGLV